MHKKGEAAVRISGRCEKKKRCKTCLTKHGPKGSMHDNASQPSKDHMEGDAGRHSQMRSKEYLPTEPNVYGDGSLKCPTNQWWAIGGYGLWWPKQTLKANAALRVILAHLPSQGSTWR